MITLKCNIAGLRLSDVTPNIVFRVGTVEIDDRIVRRSAQLRTAIKKGEIKVVPPAVQRPKPAEKGLKRRRGPAPIEEPSYEELHNRFVESVKGLDRSTAPDVETHRLLRELITSVDRLGSQIGKVSYVPSRTANPKTSTHVDRDVPVFIPSVLASPDVKGSRIKVEENEDGSLGSAEDDLRNLMEKP